MSVKAITAAEVNAAKNRKQNNFKNKNNNPNQSTPSFQGLANLPVAVADAINNGGFAFSFIAQDGFGMAIPRVVEGINRREVNPETGKKEGPYNWAFARREGIREILSGPSAFIIPAIILKFVKKYSGQANNVPVSMIQGLGNNFMNYAAENTATLDDVVKTREGFYQRVFKNVLNTTLNGQLSEDKLNELSKSYMQRAIEIESAKDNKKSLWKKITGAKVEGSPEDLTDSLLRDFMSLKKKYLDPSVNEGSAQIVVNPEKIGKYGVELVDKDKEGIGFKKLLKTMTDFTDDVIDSTGKAMEKAKNGFNKQEAEEFLKNFVARRSGSRIITNLGMWSAVVGFYALIPHLYSIGLGGKNPAFMNKHNKANNTEKAQNTPEPAKDETKKEDKDKKDVSFGGREQIFARTAERVTKSDKLKNILSHFEFDDASMSVPAMLALLFGFCLPTRLLKAKEFDKYDVKETLARDVTSFGAILFAAHAISRAFSNLFSKISGLALNIKPENHNKNLWNKFKNYFSPMGGINVLDNRQLDSKYTNIHLYKDGVSGCLDFVSGNNGNLRKFLRLDKTVEENAKIIVGKEIKDATEEEIKTAFKNITTDKAKAALKAIEDVFKDSKNKYVKHAKLYNSMFTFLSTIVLVPSFMIWLARTCDRMTRNARARDEQLAAEKKNNNEASNTSAKEPETNAEKQPDKTQNQDQTLTQKLAVKNIPQSPAIKPTMQGFLNT